jgi:hypothetical protein
MYFGRSKKPMNGYFYKKFYSAIKELKKFLNSEGSEQFIVVREVFYCRKFYVTVKYLLFLKRFIKFFQGNYID